MLNFQDWLQMTTDLMTEIYAKTGDESEAMT
jgi:hypothetical protein